MPPILESPYARQPAKSYRWLKGNLHSHTTLSDGSREPQTVIDLYAKLAYDFMALSDHDVFSDYSRIDPRGMMLLLGNEVTAFGPHILQIGSSAIVLPHENRQQVIDNILSTGGLAVLNHPNWEADWDHYPFELMQSLKGYHGIEIFNGVCLDLEGSHLGLDKWERLLSSGRKVWGYAHDDSHHVNHEGRGWNMVQVESGAANPAGILAALKAGSCYASTGVTIDTLEVTGSVLHIHAANAQEIEIYADRGVRLAVVKGPEITFDAAPANATYIRAQLYGPGSAMAWTQPFQIKGGMAEGRRLMEEKFGAFDAPRPSLTALRVDSIGAPGSAALEALWPKAPESLVAFNRVDGSTPPVKTTLRALISSKELAIRIDCEEPLMDQLRIKTPAGAGNGSLWAEESLELFLDTEASRKRYFHIMANPAGAFFATDPQGWSKNLKYQVHATRRAKGWSVEMVFDLATLAPGIAVPPGSRFGLHLCRNRFIPSPDGKRRGQHSLWSWVGSANHTPARFGWLQL